MIEASERILKVNSPGVNPAVKRHYELQIKTLQDALRNPDKLERLLQGQIDQESGITTLQLKAEQGVTGTFENQDTQVSIIGPN